jgi:hypothetical protein
MIDSPKLGDYVVLSCKTSDNSLWEGTEGFVLGTFEDNKKNKYLIIDRSTYDCSLKSVFYSLGLHDLFLIDTSEIESIVNSKVRERPSGFKENMRFKMEIDYKSNVDYTATKAKLEKLEKMKDCIVKINQPSHTEGCITFSVSDIRSFEGATICFSPYGNVQIHCLPTQLNACLAWLEKTVEIQVEHNRLVLTPTNFMLNIHDNFKEDAKPTEELINRLALMDGTEGIVFPLGWVNHFFQDMDYNILKAFFPDSNDLSKVAIKQSKESPSIEVIMYLIIGI